MIYTLSANALIWSAGWMPLGRWLPGGCFGRWRRLLSHSRESPNLPGPVFGRVLEHRARAACLPDEIDTKWSWWVCIGFYDGFGTFFQNHKFLLQWKLCVICVRFMQVFQLVVKNESLETRYLSKSLVFTLQNHPPLQNHQFLQWFWHTLFKHISFYNESIVFLYVRFM